MAGATAEVSAKSVATSAAQRQTLRRVVKKSSIPYRSNMADRSGAYNRPTVRPSALLGFPDFEARAEMTDGAAVADSARSGKPWIRQEWERERKAESPLQKRALDIGATGFEPA